MTQQVETATVLGTIDTGGAGNASVIVTARDISSSPVSLSVAVSNSWTASQVADAIRDALAYNSAVAAAFLVSGTGADVKLTRHVSVANDSTLNIAIDNGTCAGLTAAPTSANTTAGDGLSNAYATLDELKSTDILGFSDTTHDATLEREINAASRKIDEFCDRFFYQESGTKYYTPERGDEIKIDDLYSSTGLTVALDSNRDATYDVSLSSSDWDLWPYNPKNGRPWVKLMMTYLNGYSFYMYPKSVSITSSYWGWSAVPPEINQACVMTANRLHKRNHTILGQAGASAVGNITLRIPKLDPDVMDLILPFRKSLT